MTVLTGDTTYFPSVDAIPFEGLDSDNPLAYRWYDPDRQVMGQPMRDLFKFAVAYWHSFCGTGADPFGPGTKDFPWDAALASGDWETAAKNKMDAAFEFITKLGVDYYCFHDFDLVQEGPTLAESTMVWSRLVDSARVGPSCT
ncbi:MAG: xylose isomerase, partial [Planctomycetota bacterium]